jgi:hypothetical protein
MHLVTWILNFQLDALIADLTKHLEVINKTLEALQKELQQVTQVNLAVLSVFASFF